MWRAYVRGIKNKKKHSIGIPIKTNFLKAAELQYLRHLESQKTHPLMPHQATYNISPNKYQS